MKIKAIIVITLLFNVCLKAQHYDKIATHFFGNDTLILNKTDFEGLKQGLWVHYILYFNTHCSGLSSHRYDTCFYENSRGTYVNNKKMGHWAYYGNHGCYHTDIRTEFYYPDGSVKETKYNRSMITFFSPDSTEVNSEFYTSTNDTLYIKCDSKHDCNLTFKNSILSTFKLQYLDTEQYRVSLDLYRREIFRIKKGND